MKHEEKVARFYKMKSMKEQRYSLREIGTKYGVTRQRVFTIIKSGIPKQKESTTIQNYLVSVGQNHGRGRIRELVRLRDKHTCQDCGVQVTTVSVRNYNAKIKLLKGKKKALDVHHINGKCGKFSKAYESKKMIDDMVTLCHKCHYNRPEHITQSKEWSQKTVDRHNKKCNISTRNTLS